MKSLYKYIFALAILGLLILAPFFYLRLSNPTLSLEGYAPYIVYLNTKEIQVDTSPFEIKLEPGSYSLNFVKEDFSAEPLQVAMIRGEDQKLSIEFNFEAQLQEVEQTAEAQEEYFNNKCPSKVASGSGALIYCYNEVQGGNIFEQKTDNKLRPVTQITDMPDALLALSTDGQKALLFQVLMENGKAYLVDLRTGKKERLWEGENIMSAKFSEDGEKVIFERIIGEFMYEMVPVEIVIFNIANGQEFVLDQRTRLPRVCVDGDNLFWIDYETREKINPVESFSDLAEEAKNIITQDSEYVEIPVLKMSELGSSDDESIFEFEEENDLIILSCNESRVTFQDYDGKYYQVALEESAMQD